MSIHKYFVLDRGDAQELYGSEECTMKLKMGLGRKRIVVQERLYFGRSGKLCQRALLFRFGRFIKPGVINTAKKIGGMYENSKRNGLGT
jgi:hypothetical protein